MKDSCINLLNGMHEGILIISCSPNVKGSQFLYCNTSAKKMITAFLGPIEEYQRNETDESKDIKNTIMME